MLRATPEVGTRLADRYRLDECTFSNDGVTVWHALDEMLARTVGVYLVPLDHELAEPVLAAAQSAAALDDSRFVRILDAVKREGTVLIVHEWLPTTRTLREVLSSDGPMDPLDAQVMITEATEGLARAHEAGLSHLRLQPETILLTRSGQVKVYGLCVEAALHGITSTDPARSDARGLARVLHAALTATWPEGEAFGLDAAPFDNGAICTPRQIRAGVPDAVDEIVDRGLNPNPRSGTPLASPAEVAALLRELPAPRAAMNGAVESTGSIPRITEADSGRPWRPSSAARSVRIAVVSVMVIGLVLLVFQIARSVGSNKKDADASPTDGPMTRIRVTNVQSFDPPPRGDGSENPNQTRFAVDGRPSTAWHSLRYNSSAFGGKRTGIGLVLDLGRVQTVRQVKVGLVLEGASVEVRAAGSTDGVVQAGGVVDPPQDLGSYLVAASREGAGTQETLRFAFPTRTRFLLVWFTKLPKDPAGGYRAVVSEVAVSG